MFMIRTILLFLFGFALALPLMAQELTEKTEDLNLEIEGEGPSTNRVIFETGIQDEVLSAPAISLGGEPPDEASILQEKREKTVSSTNSAMHATLSFLMNTGIQYAEEGEYKEAERAYLRALETNPKGSGIRFRLSTLYIMMDRYVEAVPILEALVAEVPDNSQVRNNLAWCYATGEGVRNKTLALRHARESLLSAPISPSVWNTLAEAYYMGGEYDRALRASEHAIDLLIQTDRNQTGRESFEAQRMKIQRAAKALRMLDGLEE